MLQALKNQLTQLAADPRDPFAAKIRERVGARRALLYAKPLRDLILVMPQLITQIQVWCSESKIPSRMKRLHGFVLSYLYHPYDFIPDEGTGLFGYLDDAYLVASVYERTRCQMDHAKRPSLHNMEYIAEQIPAWQELARQFLPSETQRIEYMLDEFVEGRTKTFQQLLAQGKTTSRGG